jgi:hypothetical protein
MSRVLQRLLGSAEFDMTGTDPISEIQTEGPYS